MTDRTPDQILSTILRHDAKVTSYKIALLRAINDVVLAFPDVHIYGQDIAVPLRILADYWIAYYWPFVAPGAPIWQGPHSQSVSGAKQDMAFRPALTALRAAWEEALGVPARPADGYVLIAELRLLRKRNLYPASVTTAYQRALTAVSTTLTMPIRYAGPGQWSVFTKPQRRDHMVGIVPVPGTAATEHCLKVPFALWQTFRTLSLWIEALCVHEWCLFTETVRQDTGRTLNRGTIYLLLTDRPDNRRPLTWERNQIDLLLLEGQRFTCPWTERQIATSATYDLDHLLPVAVYPANELWNLIPTDPAFNRHTKRDRVPSSQRLDRALPHIIETYGRYTTSSTLTSALHQDVAVRFATIPQTTHDFPTAVATAVGALILQLAESRNLAQFV